MSERLSSSKQKSWGSIVSTSAAMLGPADTRHAVALTPSPMESSRDAFRYGRLVWVFLWTFQPGVGAARAPTCGGLLRRLLRSMRNLCLPAKTVVMTRALMCRSTGCMRVSFDRLHESDEEQVEQAVLTESLAVLAVLSIEQLDTDRVSMVCGVVTVSVDFKNWSNLLDIQTQSKTNTTIMFLSEKDTETVMLTEKKHVRARATLTNH